MANENADLPASGTPVTRPEPSRQREYHRRPPIVGPVILIGLGLMFLGYNLGMVPASTLAEAWRLWPLVLILAGLEIVIGRTNWAATIATVLAAIAIMGFFATMVFFLPLGARAIASERSFEFSSVEASSVERVTEDLSGAQEAVIDLRHGAGTVFVSALPSDSDKLVEADLGHGEYSAIERSVDRQGDRVSVRLENRMDREVIHFGDGPREDWSISLSPRIPVELAVRSGASDLRLDLRGLQVTRLSVEAGASAVNVTLPESAGRTDAFIKAGAAGVEVRVPEGVSARIKVSGGLSGIDVDESRFPKMDGYYQSSDYNSAQDRVELTIETGISGVNIR